MPHPVLAPLAVALSALLLALQVPADMTSPPSLDGQQCAALVQRLARERSYAFGELPKALCLTHGGLFVSPEAWRSGGYVWCVNVASGRNSQRSVFGFSGQAPKEM